MSGSYYCSTHTCHKKDCTKKIIKKSRYCSSHTCERGSRGCYNEVPGANAQCISCKNKATQKDTKTSTTKTSNSKTSSSTTKKKYSMPDCDDYEDYDDFMDEWDGCMPDGSDAEDYWENW